jgi:hypothetical protein
MADRGPRKRASTGKQAETDAAESPAAATSCTTAAPPERKAPSPAARTRRNFSPGDLHDVWEDLSRDLRLQVAKAGLSGELRDSLVSLTHALDDWLTSTTWFEQLPSLWRNLLGAYLLTVGEFVEDLVDAYKTVPDSAQQGLAREVERLTGAIAARDLSRLLSDDGLSDDELEAVAGAAASDDMAGGHVLYTVREGPAAGAVRPAVIIEHDDEKQQAAIHVFWKASDVPHEPPAALDVVAYDMEGTPGTWRFSGDVALSLADESEGPELAATHDDGGAPLA